MKQTPNLLLKLPEPTDFVLVEDFNENFTKIDEEIAKITDEETGVEAKLTKHLAQVTNLPEANKILKLNESAKFPPSVIPFEDVTTNGLINGNRAIVSDGFGETIFPYSDSLIKLYATDSTNPDNFLFAIGYKGSQGVDVHVLHIVNNNVLGLGTSNTVGTQVITGGIAENIIVYAVSIPRGGQ